MPFVGSMSTTNLRGDYTGRPFVCVTPATIVFQAQINITQTGKRATHTYTNVTTGSFSAIRVGMTVLVHQTQTDLYNYVFRGRARAAATATNILTNETDQAFTVNFYITVIDDYDVFPRLARRSNDTNFIDFDVEFERLPPCIGNLQSSYVRHTTSSTASFSFAPVVTAMEFGATISTYLWNVADGTITTGSTSTKDITVTFPAWASGGSDGHRWVSLTATDSNSVSHTFYFEVFVGNLYRASFVAQDIDRISWSANWDYGYNGQIVLHGNGAGLIPNNRVTVAYIDNYNGTSTPYNTSVAFIGRLRTDDISNTGEDYLLETSFTVEGFGTQLSNLACPKFAVFDVDSPVAWGDIIDPTPVRAIWHTVTRFSTFATVCSFDFLSAYNNYVVGVIEVEAQGVLDGINRVASRIMAQVTFAPSGEWRLRQTASYLATKTGLTTVASLTTRDMLSFTINKEHAPRVGYVEGAGLIYAPSSKTYSFYTAKAPSIMNTSGEEVQQINGLILDSTSPATAANELSRFVGTHLSRMQNLYTLDVTLFDAWREVVPSNYDWYTFTVGTGDNNRGISIGTGRNYLLTSVSWDADVATSSLSIQAQFVQDVDASGTGQDVARIPNLTTPYPANPIQLPYGGTYLPDGAGTTYNPTDNPNFDENPIPSGALDPLSGAPEGVAPQPLGFEWLYYVPMSTGTVIVTDWFSVNNQPYRMSVEGFGNLGTSVPAVTYNYKASNTATITNGTWASTVGIQFRNQTFFRRATFTQNITTGTISSVTVTHVRWSAIGYASNRPLTIRLQDSSGNNLAVQNYIGLPNFLSGVESSETFTWNPAIANVSRILVDQYHEVTTQNPRVTALSYSSTTGYTGDADAFYYNFQNGNTALAFPSGTGLLVDTLSPSPLALYNPNHTYSWVQFGTGSVFQFVFFLPSYTGVQARNLLVKVRAI